jgi:hypothetical protein
MAKGRMIFSSLCPTWLRLLGLIGLGVYGCAPAQAQQFSADLVTTDVGGTATASAGRLRVFNDKVRIETAEFADGFFLIDGPNRSAYFARSAERIFMDARQSSRLTQLFVPVDPDDPCQQWQSMAKLAGSTNSNDPWRCERIGEATVEGRSTTAYRTISPLGRQIIGWIDLEFKFPLRIEMEDGSTVTVQNIQEGPQSARLFEIPPGFHKFDPRALIKRIKQSDVWVDKPPP